MPRNETISLDEDYDADDYDRAQREAEAEHDYPEPAPARRGKAKPKAKAPAKRTTIPANAPKPQDHKAPKKTAAQREAEGIDEVEVEFDGEIYEIAADPIDWEVSTTEAFEQGKVVTAIRQLLGPEQWKAVSAKRYRNRQFRELFDLLAEAGGFDNSGN